MLWKGIDLKIFSHKQGNHGKFLYKSNKSLFFRTAFIINCPVNQVGREELKVFYVPISIFTGNNFIPVIFYAEDQI